MLSYEEMQYFTAFAKDGTLTKVAEEYHISQPTITRTMKKAEEWFAVPLFDRTKNSISLNENGKLAAQELTLLLKQTDEMVERIQSFDRARRTISLGTAAAIQLPDLISLLSRSCPELPITSEQRMPQDLAKGLDSGLYQLIVFPKTRAGKNVLCASPVSLPDFSDRSRYLTEKIGHEHLQFLLPKTHRLARRESLSLHDLDGETILLYGRVGFWEDIVREKMPHSHFVVQNERTSFQELIVSSTLPCFSTDISQVSALEQKSQRVRIPISDEEIDIVYYLVCTVQNRKLFESLFEK